ncbi:hypothetical protein TI03_03295, partial [Achromatium sp. WMS1]
REVLAILAGISIIGGNLLALLQTNVKRLLAFSSIAHFGILTIATSLQGWPQTKILLNKHWYHWEIRQQIALELTAECTAPYIDYWLNKEQEDGYSRIYQQAGRYLHDVWFIYAHQPIL